MLMKRLTFARGCALALTGLVGARIIVFVVTVDLLWVSNDVLQGTGPTYDATVRAGTTLVRC